MNHSGWKLPVLVALAALLSFSAGRAAAADRFKTGTYFGAGFPNHSITNLGFAPDFVIIKGVSASPAVARSSTMSGDASKDWRTARR